MALSMFAVILIPFVFTLAVILLVKAPKVGAALIGALLVLGLTAFVGGRMAPGHGGFGMPGFMEVVIVMPFIFVLLVLMFVKAPKVGAMVIMAVVVAVLLGAVLRRHQVRTGHVLQIRQQTQHNDGIAVVDRNFDRVYEEFVQVPPQPILPSPPVPSAAPAGGRPSPIWSEGVENEYEADVYPSRRAAVEALAARLEGWVQDVAEDANEPVKIVLFQDEWERSLMWRFERALEDALPGMPCAIEAGHRNIGWDEIGITLGFEVTQSQSAPWDSQGQALLHRGRVVAHARHRERETTAIQSFMEKPWADDFTTFANEHSDRQFIVARSQEACTSENEARRQAEEDACVQILGRLDRVGPAAPGQRPPAVVPADILKGGFIVDQFVQSFDGLSGRLWRQAVLIDASPEKLARLEQQQNAQMHTERLTWAGMVLSALGVVVVILATYLFLNMATRGYYVWSLRIAGTVLAIAGIVSVLLVLR